MLKAALLCSSICCLAFVGGTLQPTPQAGAGAATQSGWLEGALKPLIGKSCAWYQKDGKVRLNFETPTTPAASGSSRYTYRLDAVGRDFVQLSNSRASVYVPFSSIVSVWTD